MTNKFNYNRLSRLPKNCGGRSLNLEISFVITSAATNFAATETKLKIQTCLGGPDFYLNFDSGNWSRSPA